MVMASENNANIQQIVTASMNTQLQRAALSAKARHHLALGQGILSTENQKLHLKKLNK